MEIDSECSDILVEGVDTSKTYYVLDPDGKLPETSDCFYQLFKELLLDCYLLLTFSVTIGTETLQDSLQHPRISSKH